MRERFGRNRSKSPVSRTVGPYDKYTGEFERSDRFSEKVKTKKPAKMQDTGSSYSMSGAGKRKSQIKS